MLKRKIFHDLLNWKEDPALRRKALLLTGARQIGKSSAIRHLGQTEYRSFVEVNLLEDSNSRIALSQASDTQDFLNRLALIAGAPLIEGETLVFIDEIQEFPDIVTHAKFLVEDGRYDYAFSGSMLGTEFKGVRSFPVGFAHALTMRPMDFEEFCWAVGITKNALDEVRHGFATGEPVADYIHQAMLKNFRTYAVVGGMPEVVQRFVEDGRSLASIRPLQDDLNEQYAFDISKYAGARALHVRSVFDRLPAELQDKSPRFTLTSLGDSVRYDKYEQDFQWLVHAGVGLKVNRVTEPRPALKRTEVPSNFKLYQSDTGMLIARYPQPLARAVYLDEKESNLGAIFENAIAQELFAAGLSPYYFQTRKVGEVDFLIEGSEGVVALEVKSGNDYLTHASLTKVMSTEGYDISRGIVLCRSNFETRDGISYMPWYASICFPEFLKTENFPLAVERV